MSSTTDRLQADQATTTRTWYHIVTAIERHIKKIWNWWKTYNLSKKFLDKEYYTLRLARRFITRLHQAETAESCIWTCSRKTKRQTARTLYIHILCLPTSLLACRTLRQELRPSHSTSMLQLLGWTIRKTSYSQPIFDLLTSHPPFTASTLVHTMTPSVSHSSTYLSIGAHVHYHICYLA